MRHAARLLRPVLVAGALALAAAAAARQQPRELEVTYLANEGVLLRGGQGDVLIDALFGEGLPGYDVVSDRATLERGAPPYDRVRAVLVSHRHRDHFDAAALGRFLAADSGATAVLPRDAADALLVAAPAARDRIVVLDMREPVQPVELGPDTVRALRLPHGPTTVPAANAGYLVRVAGLSVLHVGDALLTAADWQALALTEAIDVALLPYWYMTTPELAQLVREVIGPRHLVALHAPRPGHESERMRAAGGWAAVSAGLARENPDLWIPTAEGERRTYPGR